MANVFRHALPRPNNAIVYGVALSAIAWQLPKIGPPIWAMLTARLSWFEIIVFVGFSIYMTVFWSLGLFYLWLDAVRESFKAGRAATRWRRSLGKFLADVSIQQPESTSSASSHETPDVPLARSVKVVLRNQLLGTWPMLVLLHWALTARGVSIGTPIPSAGVFLGQLAVMILCEEFLFFSVHRAFHWRPLFRLFHRVHHEYRKPTGIATHYVHYVEHLIGNLLPVFSGVVLVGAHPLVIFVWTGLAVTNAIHTHGGYAFWGMPYAHDHDFHHFRLRGNYGSLGVLDWLFGTSREFRLLSANTGARMRLDAKSKVT